MKFLEVIKKILCCALLGAFTISCNTPSDKEAGDKEVVIEDKVVTDDKIDSEDSDKIDLEDSDKIDLEDSDKIDPEDSDKIDPEDPGSNGE